MHEISDKDKKIWNFYVSNLKSIKKAKKNIKVDTNTSSIVTKVLKPNFDFTLDSKIKKQVRSNKSTFDAIVDLHGKTEIQAYEIIKNFIKDSYLNNFKSIIIITERDQIAKVN